jgi:hypothetical protein
MSAIHLPCPPNPPDAVPEGKGTSDGGSGRVPSDADLEFRIDAAALRLHTAPTPDERKTAWAELRRLHALRTPERVAQMEIQRGLAR